MPEYLSAADAVGSLTPDSSVVLPPGCSEVLAFERELGSQRERLAGMRISSGLLLGDYAFLGDGTEYRYTTWHVMGPVRQFVADGVAAFLPIKGSQVTRLFARGRLEPDVAVVHVSPPDAQGRCSLGTSASYPLSLARMARRVIAQVNPAMPRSISSEHLQLSDFDIVVEVDEPLLEYTSAPVDATSQRIGELVSELIPDGAVLQIGIGGIPEALLTCLQASGRRNLTLWGMGVDSAVELVEQGVFGGGERPAIVTAEMMGTRKLFDFAHENPQVQLEPFEHVLDPREMALSDSFISVNSAVEIDLTGQVNSEFLGGKQLSGVGGGFDFLSGGLLSRNGRSIIALTAEAGGGKFSRIVPRLAPDAPVSVPRHCVQTVVTEYGVAHLEGLSLQQRAAALIEIASPRFRDELAAATEAQGVMVADA